MIQPTVSHYRAPLIRLLLSSETVDFRLFGRFINSGASDDAIATASDDVLSAVTPLRAIDLWNLRWDLDVVTDVLRGDYDAWVLEGRVYTVSTWIALLVGRMTGKPILLWGHGWKRDEAGLKAYLRTVFYRASKGLLVYSESGRDRVTRHGIDPSTVRVVNNSIYPRRVLTVPSNREDIEDLRLELKIDPQFPVVVVSGRLTRRHQLSLLADAIDLMDERARPTVLVIGDGSDRFSAEERFGASPIRAVFVGAEYSNSRLRNLYALANIAVAPAAAGLNVIQSLGFHVPVVAPHDDPTSGPEIDAVREGETGWLFRHGDAGDLAERLSVALQSEETQLRYGAAGRDLVLEHYTSESHAHNIENAILESLGRRSR